MRQAILFPTLLALAALTAGAQQELAPTTDQGPIAIKPAAPTPGADGVYDLDPGITPPELVNAVRATYPPDASETDHPHICVLEVVVGIDGSPTSVHVVNPNPGPFDDSAVAAVKQSRFQPGSLNGKPVPVLVRVRVPFFHLAAATPRMQSHVAQFGNATTHPRDPMALRPGDTPPKPLNTAEAEYTDEARKKKIQGVVIVSVLVNEEGVPIDPKVVRSVDPGLDQSAIECALKYKFQPAMRDGVPIAARITIETNFRLH